MRTDASFPALSAVPRRLSWALLVIFAVALAPSLAQAQTHLPTADDVLRASERRPGVSPRSIGIGGVGTAGIADVNALYTNPAGLGYYASSEFSTGLSILLSGNDGLYQAPDGTNGLELDATDSNAMLTNINLVYKSPTEQGSLVFAAGYNRTASFLRDLSFEGTIQNSSVSATFLPVIGEGAQLTPIQGGAEITFPETISGDRTFIGYESGAIEFFEGVYLDDEYPFKPAVSPSTTINQAGTVERSGDMNEISFAAAFEAAKDVMVGGGANILIGSYRYDQELIETAQGGDANDDYVVECGDNTLCEGLDRILYREGFEDDITGFNLRAGVSARLTPELRFGVSFESPTWTAVERTYTLAAVRTDFQDGQTLSYGFSGEPAAVGSFDYETRTPMRLSAGLAYESDGLLVSGDVEFVDWSQIDIDAQNNAAADRQLAVVTDRADDDYSYVFNLRGGVEYTLDAGLSVRGGAAYRPDPREGRALIGENPRDRLYLSGGLGYTVNEQFQFNVGWMQERLDDSFRPYGAVDFNGLPGSGRPLPSDLAGQTYRPPTTGESVVRNLVQFGVRFQF